MTEVASSVGLARASQCGSGSKKGKKAGSGDSSTIGSRPRSSATNLSRNRQLSVKLKQLHMSQVKRDLQLKEKAAHVESETVLLQVESERVLCIKNSSVNNKLFSVKCDG